MSSYKIACYATMSFVILLLSVIGLTLAEGREGGLILKDSDVRAQNTCACLSPWQYLDKSMSCKCGTQPFNNSLICEEGKNLTVLNSNCVTLDNSNCSTYFGNCIYNLNSVKSQLLLKQDIVPSTVDSLEEFMCGKHFNRTGILCGRCKDGHYPLAYSLDMNCVKCPNSKSNWLIYLVVTMLPLTLFYLFVVLFQVNNTFTHLQGFVLFCQGIALPGIARALLVEISDEKKLENFVRAGYTFFGIWNLDTFRSYKLGICLGTNTLQTLALEYFVGVYPLFLVVLSYLLIQVYDCNFKPLVTLWKPFKNFLNLFRQSWNIRTSLIDTFTAFFYLSYVKILSVSYDLLAPVMVYKLDSNGHFTQSWRLYYSAGVVYFGEEHLFYAILALVMLTFFIFAPTLLLFVYPFHWFQKFLNLLPFRWYILHTFADTLMGCFKSGTEQGTWDCRYFAFIPFLLRLLVMLTGMLTQNIMYFPLGSMIVVLTAILYVTVQPYKADLAHFTGVNCIFFMMLAIWYIAVFSTGLGYKVSAFTTSLFLFIVAATAAVCLFYVTIIALNWIYKRLPFGYMINRLYAWRYGYSRLEH